MSAFFRIFGSLVAAVPLLAVVATSAGSCVSLYDLDNFNAAVSQMCGMVAECDASFYPSCVAQANARLDEATADERAAFLVAFTDTGCLETCNAAKSCFDLIPLCSTATSDCEVEAQCCGFWTAGAQCGTEGCCQPDGVACSENSDCCNGTCTDFEGGKTCGGIECAQLDESCAEMDCCGSEDATSELRCSVVTNTCVHCEALDAPCSSGADCCTNYCDNAESGAETGSCGNPACGFLNGQPCEVDDDCCSNVCVKVGRAGSSVCNDERCIPDGFACAEHDECCSLACGVGGLCLPENIDCTVDPGFPCALQKECCAGVCHSDDGVCCLTDGDPCLFPTDCCSGSECMFDINGTGTGTCTATMPCGGIGTACMVDADCCSVSCDQELTGECCNPPMCHNVCIAGDPMTIDCDDADGSSGGGSGMMLPIGKPDPMCIDNICIDMPECCCIGWTDACVEAVRSANCGIECDLGTFP